MSGLSILDGKLRKVISSNLLIEANILKQNLITVYLESYNNLLSDIVLNKDSLSNPELFYEDYKKALTSFNYFDSSVETITEFKYRIPTEDTFTFNGRLSFIKLLINGVVGTYYELPEAGYMKLVSTISGDKFRDYIINLPKFFSEDTPSENRFYLLGYEEKLHKIVSTILRKDLIMFPFSNTPPINLFSEGISFFENTIDGVINRVIDDSINFIKRGTN